jgi:hypothetical protein
MSIYGRFIFHYRTFTFALRLVLEVDMYRQLMLDLVSFQFASSYGMFCILVAYGCASRYWQAVVVDRGLLMLNGMLGQPMHLLSLCR